MKHSIARYILGTIIAVMLVMCAVIVALEADEAQKEAYNSAHTVAYGSAETLAVSYSGYDKNTLMNDETTAKDIQSDMHDILDDFDILHIYLLIPTDEADALIYKHVEGAPGEEETIAEIQQRPKRKLDVLSDEVKRVAFGESEHEDVEIKNKFGHVLTSYVAIRDNSGKTVAVSCVDISVSAIEENMLSVIPGRVAITLIIGIIGVFVLYNVLKRRVISPLRRVRDAMDAFGKDANYDTPALQLKSKDEFALIGESFNNMTQLTRENIKRIKEYKHAQDEQMFEMHAASEIQVGFVPEPHFETCALEINCCMHPAKDVGGDFYDYFECDGKMVAVIADVSGKGLSGAIFMASAISLIRGFAKQGLTPDKVLQAANRELEQNNPNMMFVTVFLCYVDTATGVTQYCNAGHNAPYVLLDGRTRQVNGASSMPLGVFAEEEYECAEEFFPLGSTLFLYTDGVNEAVREDGEQFGYDRLERVLQRVATSATNDLLVGDEASVREGTERERVNNNPSERVLRDDASDLTNENLVEHALYNENRDICEHANKNPVERVLHSVNEFVGDFTQSDDITMLALTAKADALDLPAEISAFEQLRSWILNDEKIADGLQRDICLVAEEMFVNIASYAYKGADSAGDTSVANATGESGAGADTDGAKGSSANSENTGANDTNVPHVRANDENNHRVRVRKRVSNAGCYLQFSDAGAPFDPTENIVEIDDYDPFTQVGGLGRFVTQSTVDVWRYTNFDGLNVSLLIKRNKKSGMENCGQKSDAGGDAGKRNKQSHTAVLSDAKSDWSGRQQKSDTEN